MNISFIFPGQGAQFVGMAKDFFHNSSAAKECFLEANEILGYDLSSICFEGPEEKLTSTDIAQPAIYVSSLAAIAALEEKIGEKIVLDQTAGLSLGEYTAMAAAQVFSFADGLKLVQLRGKAMQKASQEKPSSMTSVIGLDKESLDLICKKTEDETNKVCQVANLNSPGQIVVSGELEALDIFEKLALEGGARRAIRLTVSGAFHSEVMRPASEQLESALISTEFKTPICPVWQNATAESSTDLQLLRENLVLQLCSPVLWQESFLRMSNNYTGVFVEPAPGKVLSAMAKKINRESTVIPLPEYQYISELLQT